MGFTAKCQSTRHYAGMAGFRYYPTHNSIGSGFREHSVAFGPRDFRRHLRCAAATPTARLSHGICHGFWRSEDDDGAFNASHGLWERQVARDGQTDVLRFCGRRVGRARIEAGSPSEKTAGRRTRRSILPVRTHLDRFFHGYASRTSISTMADSALCWRRLGRAISNLFGQALRFGRVNGRRRWHNIGNSCLAKPDHAAQLGILDLT